MGQQSFGSTDPTADRYRSVRTGLRVAGVVLTLVAIVLVIIGLADFFGGGADGPDHFWIFFLALPLLAVGSWCLQAGFLGAFLGFAARESAPAVRRFGEAFAASPRSTAAAGGAASYCPSCGAGAGAGARFCASCGRPLAGEPLP